MFTTFEGDNTVLMTLVARGLLTDDRNEFGELNPRERWREGHITASITQPFKRGPAEGYDPFEVFRAVENHAVKALASAVDRCDDGPHKNALNRLCDELRGDADALADAFEIPGEALRAPIGPRDPAAGTAG